jgi:plastocyanin
MVGMNATRAGQCRRPRPLGLIAALIALLSLALIGCSSSSAGGGTRTGSGGDGTVISLKSLMFTPDKLTIKAGTKVTWRNDEPITHTVTSGPVTGIDKTTGLRAGQHPDGRFNKRLASKGATFSYTFTKPGTYSYYCDIHFGMNAEIVVTG